MSEKTRGRASKVDLLPPKIKSQLTAMLRDKQFSQTDILEEVNDIIRDAGLDDSYCLSRSGLNRFSKKMESMSARIRERREMAEIWTKNIGEHPESDTGKLLLETIKQLAFETSMNIGDDGKGADPTVINQLALIAQRVEQAEMVSFKREQAIRKEVAEQIAKTVEETGEKTGTDMSEVLKVVKEAYGISDG